MNQLPTPRPELRLGDFFGWAMAVGFFVLGGWFVLNDEVMDSPLTEPVLVQASLIPGGAFRQPMSDPPIVKIGGIDQSCNSCHALFETKAMSPRRLTQHTELVLNHGGNEWCFSCHDMIDRNLLVLEGNVTIGYDQITALCGKCHGPTLRDWQAGIHGKTMGFWSKKMGPQVRLTCTECHDPHAPAFPDMLLLPGPNTLRMGDGDAHFNRHDHKYNPLRMWQEPENKEGGDH